MRTHISKLIRLLYYNRLKRFRTMSRRATTQLQKQLIGDASDWYLYGI